MWDYFSPLLPQTKNPLKIRFKIFASFFLFGCLVLVWLEIMSQEKIMGYIFVQFFFFFFFIISFKSILSPTVIVRAVFAKHNFRWGQCILADWLFVVFSIMSHINDNSIMHYINKIFIYIHTHTQHSHIYKIRICISKTNNCNIPLGLARPAIHPYVRLSVRPSTSLPVCLPFFVDRKMFCITNAKDLWQRIYTTKTEITYRYPLNKFGKHRHANSHIHICTTKCTQYIAPTWGFNRNDCVFWYSTPHYRLP